jgi:hypothetical protein
MHAVLITFQSTAELESLIGPFTDYAHDLVTVPGLLTKTWLRDGATLGGFHLFTGRAAAESYLNGTKVAGITANPAFGEFRIQHYTVLDELSRITGTHRLAGTR